jgi:hypothetical protein
VQDPLFLNIAATTTVNTFFNSPKSAEWQLFTPFREKKTFEQMREGLNENEGYGKSVENRLSFRKSLIIKSASPK